MESVYNFLVKLTSVYCTLFYIFLKLHESVFIDRDERRNQSLMYKLTQVHSLIFIL